MRKNPCFRDSEKSGPAQQRIENFRPKLLIKLVR